MPAITPPSSGSPRRRWARWDASTSWSTSPAAAKPWRSSAGLQGGSMRYRWPKGRQSAAVLSFDFDAESGFLFREPEKAKRSLADLEERRFGPRVGVDRILRLLDRLKLRATFFIPGWTVVNHLPQSKRKIGR